MQLKLTTDYAIRTIVYLATQSGITSVAEIGSKMGISENYLMKVLKALKDAGLVAGYQGKRGGYAISKKPEEISLWDIVEVMEGTNKNQQMSGDRRILQPAWHTILHDQKILSGTAGSDGRIFIRYYD